MDPEGDIHVFRGPLDQRINHRLGIPAPAIEDFQPDHIPPEFLLRHKHGDWGVLDEEERQENERSLIRGWRLLSAYDTRLSERLWVITEADRSATTILLPDEY